MGTSSTMAETFSPAKKSGAGSAGQNARPSRKDTRSKKKGSSRRPAKRLPPPSTGMIFGLALLPFAGAETSPSAMAGAKVAPPSVLLVRVTLCEGAADLDPAWETLLI